MGAAQNHAVVAVDAAVTVGVGIFQIARFGCLSVDGGQFAHVLARLHNSLETQTVERAQRFALAQNLLLVGTLNHVVGGAHIADSVAVNRQVGTRCPLNLLALNNVGVHRKFNALVHHVAHILQLLRHAARETHRHHQQQVASFLVVSVENKVQEVLIQAKVDAHVVRHGRFPFQIVVGGVLFRVTR